MREAGFWVPPERDGEGFHLFIQVPMQHVFVAGDPQGFGHSICVKGGVQSHQSSMNPFTLKIVCKLLQKITHADNWRLVVVGVDPFKTGCFCMFLWTQQSPSSSAFFQQRCRQNNKAIFGSIFEITQWHLFVMCPKQRGYRANDLTPTLRSMSLIHFITLWLVQTMGSESWCSHFARRTCRACENKTHNWLDQHLCVIIKRGQRKEESSFASVVDYNLMQNNSWKDWTKLFTDTDLFIKTDNLQELNRQEQTGLMVLVANVEESLQVSAAQRI